MDYYKIIHPATGKVVNLYSTDSSSAVANGTRLLLYTWLDNNDQKWGLDYVGDLVLMRLARDNSKVMNRHSGNNNAIVWYYDGTAETQKDSLINTETENGNMRIKLAKRGLYLTKNADDNYLYWTSKINSNRQYFKLEKVSGSSTKGEIDLPPNRTYNWSQFTPEVMSICDRYGCSLTCLLDIANIFGPRQYSANEIYQECKWSDKGLLYWKIPSSCAGEIKSDGYNPSGTRNVFAVAKAQIQANNPIVIKLKNNSTTHFVVGVGYTGNGASTSELIVLDPGTGSKYTLQEAMNRNSMTTVVNYILTKRN